MNRKRKPLPAQSAQSQIYTLILKRILKPLTPLKVSFKPEAEDLQTVELLYYYRFLDF